MIKSTEQIFGPLNTRLFEIKSGSATISGIRDSIVISEIADNVFSLPPNEALLKINLALQTIEEINEMEDELTRAYEAMDFNNPEFDEIKKLGEAEKKAVKAKFIKNLKKEVTSYYLQLEKYRDEIIKHEEAKDSSSREKIKLDLSVDEIAVLFRGLKEAGVVKDTGHSALSRILAQSFSSKKTDKLSSSSLKNKLDTPVESTIDSMIVNLGNVIESLKKLKKR